MGTLGFCTRRVALRHIVRRHWRSCVVHHIASRCIASRPDVPYMQKHWDIMRSDNAGDQWSEVSGNLPTDFSFPIDVHAHEPETIYVVPIASDSLH